MESLRKVQAELKAPKNQYNSFGKYNYRNAEDILEALKPLLLKHKLTLTISDDITEMCGIPVVKATAKISDESSEVSVSAYAGVDMNRKGMDYAQCYGASSSYARKYALNGLFLIDDTKDPDATNDHGKAAQEQPQKSTPVSSAKPTKSATLPVVPKDKFIAGCNYVSDAAINGGDVEAAMEKVLGKWKTEYKELSDKHYEIFDAAAKGIEMDDLLTLTETLKNI